MDFDNISNKGTLSKQGKSNPKVDDIIPDDDSDYIDELSLDVGESAIVFRKDGSKELVIRSGDSEDDEVPDATLQAISILDLMSKDDDFVGIIDDNIDELELPLDSLIEK